MAPEQKASPARAPHWSAATAFTRKRRRARSQCKFHLLGFGSNYYGALGQTVTYEHNHAAQAAPDLRRSSDPSSHITPIRFLSLGHETLASDDAVRHSDTSPREKVASVGGAVSTAKGGFKKGFLLSASSSKQKKRTTAAGDAESGSHHSISEGGGVFAVQSRPAACAGESPDEITAKAAGIALNESSSPGVQSGDTDEGAEAETDQLHPLLPFPMDVPPAIMKAGSSFTVYVSSPGGIAQAGTLHGVANTFLIPKPIPLALRCIQLSCGRRHVLALMGEGPDIGRKDVSDGPISPLKSSFSSSPHSTLVANDRINTSHPAGPIRSAFNALTTGIVVSWGAGHFGQLGHGPDVTSCEPRIIERLLPRSVGGPVIHVAAGPLHSGVIVATSSSTTRTFLFGSNRRGQCGVQGGISNTVPYPSPLMKATNDDADDAFAVDNLCRLSLGRLHTVGLAETGELYSWGSGTNGRCGHGDSVSMTAGKAGKGVRPPRLVESLKAVSVIMIAAGDGHTLALTGSGRVFAWGSGSEGQLGQGHTMHLLSPRLIGDLDFAGIHSTYDQQGRLHPRTQISEPLISDQSKPRTSEDRIQNGVPVILCDRDRQDIAPALPSYLTAPEAIEAFRNSKPPPVASKPPKIVAIYASRDSNCALSSSGDVYTWGYFDPYHLGNDTTTRHLPLVESALSSCSGGGNRIRDSCSFDSRLNILIPRRLELTREIDLSVESLCLGPGHMILLCRERAAEDDSKSVGMTLHEVETMRKSNGLGKLKVIGSTRRLNDSRRHEKKPEADEEESLREGDPNAALCVRVEEVTQSGVGGRENNVAVQIEDAVKHGFSRRTKASSSSFSASTQTQDDYGNKGRHEEGKRRWRKNPSAIKMNKQTRKKMFG